MTYPVYKAIRMNGTFCVVHDDRLVERFATQRKAAKFIALCALAAAAPTSTSWAVRRWLSAQQSSQAWPGTTHHST
jgi:hypothetical protein